METKNAVVALAALAQEHRLAVFRLLVQHGPEGLAASEIASRLGLAAPTLSFHLKSLSQAGLIQARQEGRFIFYAASYGAMNDLLQFLTENCCQGESCAAGEPMPQPSRPLKRRRS
ncbi:MAG TPA: metalloregulator ArsR/SmtB family transcription factor [Steroidobacteraceae bacterium]|nr:metalloregulator ArsR/SmtB family transcription factor [Steroidobacteraceae bacterium]